MIGSAEILSISVSSYTFQPILTSKRIEDLINQ